MPRHDFEQLKRNVKGLVLMNSFFSTTLFRNVAEMFCGDNAARPQFELVLFESTVNPHISGSVPFADITRYSYVQDETEILFSIGAVFRILSVEQLDDSNQIHYVRLELCTENELEELYTFFAESINSEEVSLLTFGLVLRLFGGHKRAKEYCQRLPGSSAQHNVNVAYLHHNMGVAHACVGEYNEALAQDLKALQYNKPEAKDGLLLILSSIAQTYQELEICECKADMDKRMNHSEQYDRRTNLRFLGIDETENENTNEIILQTAECLKIPVYEIDISRNHPVGKYNPQTPTPRPIIVRFTSYRPHELFYKNRKYLNETDYYYITVRAGPTRENLNLLRR
ncbi:unnamed protein product, partial [Didymodactylos carnosus]